MDGLAISAVPVAKARYGGRPVQHRTRVAGEGSRPGDVSAVLTGEAIP
ncbi:hypothetical protein LN650_14175 [Klebsiella pneumoniae subsp. pneumoniae]|nr:hypothetical protein [Klebsiella pneumoniae subsp. pneumoniae]